MQQQPSLSLTDDDRFDRFRRISWWDQDKLAKAKIVVIGAGALGNEILKNLALLGVGKLFVADLDRIETSNLSRSILFRQRDEGRAKAQAAAEAVKDINPDARAQWFHGDVVHELGLGVYHWADLVIAGLDNREARLWINRCCWKTNTPWVDGATEILQGVVRVFVPPDGPCYECTMSAADWKVLKNERRSCAGLRPAQAEQGRVPTTPVTASVVAALECQEALKFLHGLEVLAGRGLVLDGLTNDFYVVRYNAQQDCNSHDTWEQIVPLEEGAGQVTVRTLLQMAEARLGKGTILELSQDILTAFHCPRCDVSEDVFRPRGAVSEWAARCPRCGQDRRVESTQSVQGSEPFLDRSFAALGIPPYDIVVARRGLARLAFEFEGDASAVLGPAYQPAELGKGGAS